MRKPVVQTHIDAATVSVPPKVVALYASLVVVTPLTDHSSLTLTPQTSNCIPTVYFSFLFYFVFFLSFIF